VLTKGSWIGDEALLLNDLPNYTIRTKGHVTALQIKISNMHLFPQEIITEIAKKIKAKLIWTNQRLLNQTEISTKVLNEDMPNRIYQICISQISKKYPQANEKTIQKLREIELKNEELINSHTFHRLGYIERKKETRKLHLNQSCIFIHTFYQYFPS